MLIRDCRLAEDDIVGMRKRQDPTRLFLEHIGIEIVGLQERHIAFEIAANSLKAH